MPSSLYRSELWRLGIWLARVVPQQVCERLGMLVATVYWATAPQRRRVVVANLLPALHYDRDAAKNTARRLFQSFGAKVVDLWLYESGRRIDHRFGQTSGWEHFEAARAQRRGILLVTPHLGNWEFGAPLLTRRGVALQVVTLAEPGEEFTRLRMATRAKWQTDTLVVGDSPFAFVEMIRRLEEGTAVALLIDRPPPPTAIKVELFGRPFAASIAAAELARASGCVVLPVYVVRTNNAYDAHVLPAVEYERSRLRERVARRDLTQRIMRTFEPLILEHLDQWYHFVPVWPYPRE